MPPKRSSQSQTGSFSEIVSRGRSYEDALARLPPNINWQQLSPAKQKNCERAFTAASRRSDRDIDARYQSALTASDMHFLRTGKYLRVTRELVINEDMYEEEDSHPRLWTSNLRHDSDPRMAAFNEQYRTIDMQFHAAFPGFANRNAAGIMSPNTIGTVGYTPTIPAPHADPMQYNNTVCMPQRNQPMSQTSDEPSPPPMTDSAGSSPMANTASPITPQIGHQSPPNARPPNFYFLDKFPCANTKFDSGYMAVYFNDTVFDGIAESDLLSAGTGPDEFPEFVNY